MVKILIYLAAETKITNDNQSVNQYLIFGMTKNNIKPTKGITNIKINTTDVGPKNGVECR